MYAFHYNSQGSEFSFYFLIIFTQRISGYLFHCLRIGSKPPSDHRFQAQLNGYIKTWTQTLTSLSHVLKNDKFQDTYIPQGHEFYSLFKLHLLPLHAPPLLFVSQICQQVLSSKNYSFLDNMSLTASLLFLFTVKFRFKCRLAN